MPRCATRRSAARRPAAAANDVKLSRGGIREIEFIVQLLLVVRGGQFPEIRTRSTLKALDKLAAGGLMKRASAERLAAAYTLLRRVEHRIQYLDDQQTHVLPEHDGDLAWIAASLGAEGERPMRPARPLGEAREYVAGEFDLLLRDGRGSTGNGCRSCGPAPLPVDAETFLAQAACRSSRRGCGRCATSRRSASSRTKARSASPAWWRGPAQAVAEQRCTLQAAIQFVDWLEPLLRRESYLALLAERPEVQSRLLPPARPGALADALPDAAIRASSTSSPTRSCCTVASTPRPTSASSRSATPAGSAPARPTRSFCSTPCAAPTTPRCSAPWCATSKGTSRSSRSPTTCRRWPTRPSPAPCRGPGST
jgi:hypothetical protein